MTSRDPMRLSPVADDTIVLDDVVGVAVLEAGRNPTIAWANPAFSMLLARGTGSLAGTRLEGLVDDADLSAALVDIADGSERTVRLPAAGGAIVLQLTPGPHDQIVVVATPAHATPRAAMYDAVTGLASLALFREHLQLGLHRRAREGGDLAVVVVGASRFAAAWQQQEGAASLLQTRMAERIEQVVRDADVLATRRPGGFLLLVIDPIDAVAAATLVSERMLAAFEMPLVLSDRLQPLELSLGIAATGPEDTPDDVIARADTAYARAVAAGPNRYRIEAVEPA